MKTTDLHEGGRIILKRIFGKWVVSIGGDGADTECCVHFQVSISVALTLWTNVRFTQDQKSRKTSIVYVRIDGLLGYRASRRQQ